MKVSTLLLSKSQMLFDSKLSHPDRNNHIWLGHMNLTLEGLKNKVFAPLKT